MPDLENIREQIRMIDQQLVNLLADRMALCREVGRLKAVDGVPAHIPDRVRMVTDRWVADADGRDIDPAFIRRICEEVIAESTRAQQSTMLDRRIGDDPVLVAAKACKHRNV